MRPSRLAWTVCLCLTSAGCALETAGTGSLDGAAPRPDAGRVERDGGGPSDGAPPDAGLPDGGVAPDACVASGAFDGCNGLDDDCDGMVDEDEAVRACGVGAHCRNRCVAGAFSAACENVDVLGATELCNGDDDDCDGTVDEGCICGASATQPCGPCSDGLQMCEMGTWGACIGGTTPVVYHRDADSDGFGSAVETMMLCAPMAGWVADARDCNDACASCTPAGIEICDGLDNDCDGSPDDGVGMIWYSDVDGDGFGVMAGAVTACASPGRGWAAVAGDCDDACARCRPGYPAELCRDGHDNNCNGMVDEAACPCDLHALATGTYLYCRTQSWTAGRARCMSLGGDLAIIGSAAENDAIWAAMSGYGVRIWYGASDAAREGTWVWVDGTPMSTCVGTSCTCAPGGYCNWHAGQPNATTGDNCLVVVPGWPGDWGDYPCASVESAICELP